jgi:hypothetical protein
VHLQEDKSVHFLGLYHLHLVDHTMYEGQGDRTLFTPNAKSTESTFETKCVKESPAHMSFTPTPSGICVGVLREPVSPNPNCPFYI